MKAKELVKLLEQAGYRETRQRGSHRRFECLGKPPLTIPWHMNGNMVLHPKIIKNCLKKAEII
jgi:predicted RNA binding protein YcfA (HicA-like mRNA interferase family)